VYTNMTPTIYGGGEPLLAQSAAHLRQRKPFAGCNAGHGFFHADPHAKVSICKVGRDDQIDLMTEGIDGLTRLGAIADRLIDRLISENFINEQRYARSFTHDKFTFSHWGKTKISVSLKQKGISNEAINNALATIDPNQYRETLKNILAQKSRQLNEENPFMRQRKLASHAIGKGFEPEQVISAIDQL
ncbi:MAG: regulatory protein RecX, partial [Bacteroidaceae bacterium]